MFSPDDKYLTILLFTGELSFLKVLDPADPNLTEEIAKLGCTKREATQLNVCCPHFTKPAG